MHWFVPETKCVSYSIQEPNNFPKFRSAVHSFVQGHFTFKLNFTQLTNGRIASQRIITIMLEKKLHFNYNLPFSYIKLYIWKHTNCQMCYSLPDPSEQLFLTPIHCSSDWIMGWYNTSIAHHLKANSIFSFFHSGFNKRFYN